MKISEIDFSCYAGRRIAVVTKRSIMNFPADTFDAVKRACGELEVAEDGIIADENGWLTLKTVNEEKNNA